MRGDISSDKSAFIEEIAALAVADMRRSRVLASLTIAQAILESNWGTSGLTANANALFGIKANAAYNGRKYSAKTKEFYDGVNPTEITALFRAYLSWAESVRDHSDLLTKNARYSAVVGERDYRKACQAIKDAGYATDPAYPEKLIRLIETYGLARYDGIAAQDGAVFCVGDVVEFAGTAHYSNSEAVEGNLCKPGTAEVTRISAGRPHPVHLIAKANGGSTVYGWVDLEDVRARLVMRPGAMVRYSGPVYRDSSGNGQGRSVEGVFEVKYYGAGKKCGVHLDDLGWVSESACTVIG